MNSPIDRIDYNPANEIHREALYKFMDTQKWTMFFKLKEPGTNLPLQLYMDTLQYFRKLAETEAQSCIS